MGLGDGAVLCVDQEGSHQEVVFSLESINKAIDAVMQSDALTPDEIVGTMSREEALAALEDMGVGVEWAELDKASRAGDTGTMRLLLHAGVVDRPEEKSFMRSCLHRAAQANRTLAVKELVRWGGDPTARTPAETLGQNAVHFAAQAGGTDVLKYFLSIGVPYDEPDAAGFTPFLLCVRAGHLEAAALLAECGADLSHKNADGHDCLALVEDPKYGSRPSHHGVKAYVNKLVKAKREIPTLASRAHAPSVVTDRITA
eukprot:TRINITY_DN21295_c0_g1_i1.p1 TRINITY_DN21295_c0_g1~~TRINITY_DN21295_c0_g1_i1.p1  ORF type:complete len:257 (+),score=66.52 TRINITY_DN21295_c0_g1_i1:90-860(+)